MAIISTWTFAANGNGTAANVEGNLPMQFVAQGTWGGGTMTFQFSMDSGATWINITDEDTGVIVSLSANGTTGSLGGSLSTLVRPVLTGATAPDLDVIANKVVVR